MSQPPSDATQAARLIDESPAPVTIFTLSWCSFCHAAKQLMSQLGVPFHVIELDTGNYGEHATHARLRKELLKLTGSQTLPQVFIGNQGIGGYTETQRALRDGSLKALLHEHGVELKALQGA